MGLGKIPTGGPAFSMWEVVEVTRIVGNQQPLVPQRARENEQIKAQSFKAFLGIFAPLDH